MSETIGPYIGEEITVIGVVHKLILEQQPYLELTPRFGQDVRILLDEEDLLEILRSAVAFLKPTRICTFKGVVEGYTTDGRLIVHKLKLLKSRPNPESN